MNVEDQVEKSQQLIELIMQLANPQTDIETGKKQFIDRIKSIYSSEDGNTYRHQYSMISRLLYDEEFSPDECSMVCDSLEELADASKTNLYRLVSTSWSTILRLSHFVLVRCNELIN